MIILVENNGETVGQKLIETACKHAKSKNDIKVGIEFLERALPVIGRMIEDENRLKCVNCKEFIIIDGVDAFCKKYGKHFANGWEMISFSKSKGCVI